MVKWTNQFSVCKYPNFQLNGAISQKSCEFDVKLSILVYFLRNIYDMHIITDVDWIKWYLFACFVSYCLAIISNYWLYPASVLHQLFFRSILLFLCVYNVHTRSLREYIFLYVLSTIACKIYRLISEALRIKRCECNHDSFHLKLVSGYL